MSKTLVCRCEDVTMGELVEAIARGHDDIESLKRYTGFGTGYCQGKSCVALCARLLSERGHDAPRPFTPRPPFHPLRLSDLAGLADVANADAAEADAVGTENDASSDAASDADTTGETEASSPSRASTPRP